MTARWIDQLTGSLAHKRQYKHDMERMASLAEPYRTTATALYRYLSVSAGIVDGDTLVAMTSDHVDLWERAALDGTSVRGVIGDDPVEFAESFAQAYSGTRWLDKERARLTAAIDAATSDDGASTGHDGDGVSAGHDDAGPRPGATEPEP